LADGYALNILGLTTGYGRQTVLHDVSIEVRAGEIVALIGHNGAGKSTLLKAVFRLLPVSSGQVLFEGKDLQGVPPDQMLKRGVAYVPQGNRVFPSLSVQENLQIAAQILKDPGERSTAIDRVLSIFPALSRRIRQRAGTLSGGEKQMLALSSALVISPRLLLLDEPSLGLSPALVTEAMERVVKIKAQTGASVLIVEQKVRQVLRISQRVYVLRRGVVNFSGNAETLQDEAKLKEVYL